MELVHKGFLLQHSADRKCERNSHRRRQALGYRSYRDGYARHQHIENVLAAQDSRREYRDTHDETDNRHDLSKLREPLLQRRQLLVYVREEVGDASHLRASARRDDTRPTSPADG